MSSTLSTDFDLEKIEQSIKGCDVAYGTMPGHFDWMRTMFSLVLSGEQIKISANNLLNMLIDHGVTARQATTLFNNKGFDVALRTVDTRASSYRINTRSLAAAEACRAKRLKHVPQIVKEPEQPKSHDDVLDHHFFGLFLEACERELGQIMISMAKAQFEAPVSPKKSSRLITIDSFKS